VTPLRLAALGAIAVALYANTLGVPFLFDDHHAIVTNLRIRELWPAPLGAGRPLVELTLALNYALGGLAVTGYHVMNLALHIGCGLLLFDVARRTLLLTGTAPGRESTIAWWAAALFLAHPLQIEAVTYVIGRSEVLMGLCYLGTLELILLAESQPSARPLLWPGAILTCALGMAAKPVMVTAPLAAMWLGRCVLPPHERARLSFAPDRPSGETPPARWPLYVGLAATWIVLAYLIQSRDQPGAGLDIGITPIEYLRTQLGVTWHYFGLLVWPRGQTVGYDWPLAHSWRTAGVFVPAFGWAVVIALLAWLARTGRRAAAFWLGFALLTLAPSSSVVPIADLAFEHRMYLTVGGFAVLTALAGSGLARRAPRAVTAAAVVVVAVLGVATIQRNRLWQDPVTLWEDALTKAPGKARAFRNLIAAYEERGDRAGAARVAAAETLTLERLRSAHPNDADILAALADSYARRGRIDDAVATSAEAVRLAPDDAVARAAYGSVLLQIGRAEDAVTQLEMAEVLARRRADWVGRDVMRSIQTNLGWAYATVGREDDAVRVLREAARDDNVTALNNLGSVLGRLGRWEEARELLERAAIARSPPRTHHRACPARTPRTDRRYRGSCRRPRRRRRALQRTRARSPSTRTHSRRGRAGRPRGRCRRSERALAVGDADAVGVAGQVESEELEAAELM